MKTIISGGKTHILKDAASQGRAMKVKTQKFNNHNSRSTNAEKF